MSVTEIGCCGAYCRTCQAFRDGSCHGCRVGYDSDQRDINRAKCRIKVCCLRKRQLRTCADCDDFSSCVILQLWYLKAGDKYRQYKKSAEYIRRHGYDSFIKIADNWTNAYGRL